MYLPQRAARSLPVQSAGTGPPCLLTVDRERAHPLSVTGDANNISSLGSHCDRIWDNVGQSNLFGTDRLFFPTLELPTHPRTARKTRFPVQVGLWYTSFSVVQIASFSFILWESLVLDRPTSSRRLWGALVALHAALALPQDDVVPARVPAHSSHRIFLHMSHPVAADRTAERARRLLSWKRRLNSASKRGDLSVLVQGEAQPGAQMASTTETRTY